MKPEEMVQVLPKYTHALVNDSLIYFAGVKEIATAERKAVLLQGIRLIENQLASLKQQLV